MLYYTIIPNITGLGRHAMTTLDYTIQSNEVNWLVHHVTRISFNVLGEDTTTGGVWNSEL